MSNEEQMQLSLNNSSYHHLGLAETKGINTDAPNCTCSAFDSCFCPSQAQARCHRIGQNKAVKVYRLITRNSYEREMFDRASLKLGLDKAVLQSMSGRDNSVGGATGGAVSWRMVWNRNKGIQ